MNRWNIAQKYWTKPHLQSGQGCSEALVSPLCVCVCICHQFTPLIFVTFLLPLFSIVFDVGRCAGRRFVPLRPLDYIVAVFNKKLLAGGRKCIFSNLVGTGISPVLIWRSCSIPCSQYGGVVVFLSRHATTHHYVWLAWCLLQNCPHMADRCNSILPTCGLGPHGREGEQLAVIPGRKHHPTAAHSQGCVITLHITHILLH